MKALRKVVPPSRVILDDISLSFSPGAKIGVLGANGAGKSSLLLVYMAGNLAMKSVTTPLLRRFGFRDVIRVNGTLCAAALVACGLLSPAVHIAVVYAVLFVAGMTRSMHFTSMNTLSFADVPPRVQPGGHDAVGDGTTGRGRARRRGRRPGARPPPERPRGGEARIGRFPECPLRRSRADGSRGPLVAATADRRGLGAVAPARSWRSMRLADPARRSILECRCERWSFDEASK